MMIALQVTTVVVVGLMVGVELAVAAILNPILDRLPADGGQLGRADGGRVLGALMPFWYIGSLVLVGVWAFVAGGVAPLLIVAAALLAVSIVMSVLLLVPINNRNKRWTPETRPADWRQQIARWDRLHLVRVGVIVAAFAVMVVALAQS